MGIVKKNKNAPVDLRNFMRGEPLFYGILLTIMALGPHTETRKLYFGECIPRGADMNLFMDFDWKIKHSRPPTAQTLYLLWQYVTSIFRKLFSQFKPVFTFLYDPGSFGVHVIFHNVRFVKHSDNPEYNLRLAKIVAEFSHLFATDHRFNDTWKTDVECTQKATMRAPLALKPDAPVKNPTYYTIWSPNENNHTMIMAGRIEDPSFRLRCMRMGTIFASDDIGEYSYLCDLNVTPSSDLSDEEDEEEMEVLAPGENVSRSRMTASFRRIESTLSAEAKAFFLANMGHKEDVVVLPPFEWGHRGPVPVRDASELKDRIMYNIMADKSMSLGNPTAADITRHTVSVLNEHYFYLLNARPKVFMRKYDTANLVTKLEPTEPSSFKDVLRNVVFSNLSVEITDKNGNVKRITKNFEAAKIWMEDSRRRTYESLVFSPFPPGHIRAVHPGQLNTFTGWRWTPSELSEARAHASVADLELADRLQDHIFSVLCSGDEQKFQFLMTLIAAKFRRPWLRANSCACFLGHEGSGKTFFFEAVLFSMAGPYGVKCVNVEDLFANFNTKYNDKCILFFDEASYAGSHKNFAKLKNFVTSDTMDTCAKYSEAREVPNYYVCFMVTNQDRAVPLGTDARRFAIFEVAPNRARGRVMEHKAYFDRLYNITGRQNERALKTWFSQFWDETVYPEELLNEYGQFSYNVFPPSLVGVLGKHKSNTLGAVIQFWKDVLSDGRHYSPYADFLLNSLDDEVMGLTRIDFKVNTHNTNEEVIPSLAKHNQGRRLADFSENPLGAVTASMRDIWDMMRYPPYKADRTWLGFASVSQLWLEFEARRGKYKADFIRTNLDDFVSKTMDIFPHLNDPRGSSRVKVPAEWKIRSAARVDATLTNRSYVEMAADPDNYKHAAAYNGNELYWRIGSIAYCKKVFYITTGLDTTEGAIHQAKDLLDSKSNSIYSDAQFTNIYKHFQK